MELRIHLSPFDFLEEQDSRFSAAKEAYYDLIENGPAGALFRDETTRFGAAKGGSNPAFAHYFDQTHFQHALNVATAAGVLFCEKLRQLDEAPTSDEIRIVLAAGALHDFNKVVGGHYPACILENESRFMQLLGDFLPANLHDSVRHLILATEDGTDAAATDYHSTLDGKVKILAIAALAAGDALSTTGRNHHPDDVEAYRELLARLGSKHGANTLPEVHVLPIHDVPQTALVATIRNALLGWIRANGLLLHDSPRRVSWVGRPWSGDAHAWVTAKSVESLRPPFQDVVETWTIRGNAPIIRTDWVSDYNPTSESIRTIIDTKIDGKGGSSLILWDRDWLKENGNLARLNQFCPAIKHAQRSGQDTATLVLPEDDGTPSGAALRRQAQIIVASCILHTLTGDATTRNPNSADWSVDSVKGTAKKYVAGILDVIEEEPTETLLNRTLDDCVQALDKLRTPKGNAELLDVVNRVLGQPAPLLNSGQTAQACVICGSAALTALDGQNAEGLKPSGWLPRTAAIQAQREDAKICAPCVLDSAGRAQMVKNSMVKGAKSAQYLHLHRSDTAVEGDFLNLIREIHPERAPPEVRGVTLYARGGTGEAVVPHENHVTVPFPAAQAMEGQMRLLDQILSLSHDTGHKVQVTSLGGIPRSHACMVYWQNAPSWVHDLRPHDERGVWQDGLAAIRCDRVPTARKIVRAISKAAFINKTGKKVAYSPIINTLTTHPLGLYRFPCFAGKNESEHPTTTLETYFMTNETVELLEKAGHAYCKFNTRNASAWGKSTHWQWATRSTIRALEKKSDLNAAAVRGLLHNEAHRKFEGAKTEDIDTFVTAIEGLYIMHGARSDQVARDIIAAVEWTAERLYHQHYSKKAREGGNS